MDQQPTGIPVPQVPMPTKGRIVHVQFMDGTTFNGSDTHPAVVTAAHGWPYINCRVLVDGDDNPLWVTSIPHKDSVQSGYRPHAVWLWPPREGA